MQKLINQFYMFLISYYCVFNLQVQVDIYIYIHILMKILINISNKMSNMILYKKTTIF